MADRRNLEAKVDSKAREHPFDGAPGDDLDWRAPPEMSVPAVTSGASKLVRASTLGSNWLQLQINVTDITA